MQRDMQIVQPGVAQRMAEDDVLAALAATIKARRTDPPAEKSYTRDLIEAGVEKCARKFGEEAIELVIATLSPSSPAVTSEAADLLYHLLVLLEARGVAYADVLQALELRRGTSGHVEKAARPKATA